MHASNQQQQVVLGNQTYPVVTPGSGASQNSQSNGILWGSSVRPAMGFTQIICGIIEFALGITLVCLSLDWSHPKIAWGIWNGWFAVITGFLGVKSKRSKCMVITYMVLTIIAAVLSAVCCCSAAIFASTFTRVTRVRAYDIDYRYQYEGAHFVINVTLAIIFALQMLISILGASFTCGALTSRNNHQKIVYHINAQPPIQPLGPVPPHTILQTQIQPNLPDESDPTYYSIYTPLNLRQDSKQSGNGAKIPRTYSSYIFPE